MNILGIDPSTILGPVASHLAHMDAEQQAHFFAVFAEELRKACGTEYLTGMQGASICSLLTKEAREVYAQIGYEGTP